MTSLRQLQRWFGAIFEHEGTAEQALRGRGVRRLLPAGAGAVLKPNPRLSPAAMLDVYNGGYLSRLVEVMQIDFGGVQQVLGDDAFRQLVAKFLRAHPSRHANLNQLGAPFPAFVARQRALPQRPFLAELARLERTLCEAFDAPEFTPIGADALSAVPQQHWGRVRFLPNPSVRMLALRFPVDPFYQAWKDGKPMAVPAAAGNTLLVYRRDDRVWRERLQPGAAAVLQRLLAGRPLGEALAAAPSGEPVQQWFAGFARDGLFVGLRQAKERSRRA
jgi:hypothetical protein